MKKLYFTYCFIWAQDVIYGNNVRTCPHRKGGYEQRAEEKLGAKRE
jgi:hypothetical protein